MKLNFKKTIFLLTLLGILILIILSQSLSNIKSAEIGSIHFSNDITTIITTDNQTLILFGADPVDLKKGDSIKFIGSLEMYRGKNQVIVDKIWKIK